MSLEKIAKAKAGLVIDQPFFASLLLAMPILEDDSIPTMATDGDSIRFNPAWVNSLTHPELTFVLAHETLHVVFQHMCRRGERDPLQWNIAADYVINELLVTEKVGSMPKGGLYDPSLVKRGDGTAEGVYRLLGQNQKPPPKNGKGKGKKSADKPGAAPNSGFPSAGQPGGPLDDVRDAGSHGVKDGVDSGANVKPDAAKISEKESEIRVKVIQAKNAAKMQGKLSAGLERMVGELTKTRTDWRSILRRFISEKSKTDFSFARPKRRFLADDLYLPSLNGERIGTVAVAVDCSGSTDDDTLGAFSAELNGILEDTRPSEIKIVYFDAEVLKVETVSLDGGPIKLNPIGGGGTDFRPIFEEINSWESMPVACVVLTDLYGDTGTDAPSFPVLWAVTPGGADAAEFGEIVKLERD